LDRPHPHPQEPTQIPSPGRARNSSSLEKQLDKSEESDYTDLSVRAKILLDEVKK